VFNPPPLCFLPPSLPVQFFVAFDDPAVQLPQAIAWYTLCILIVNTYMLICSFQCPAIAISNFFWLELSEILLVIGQFNQQPAGTGCIKAGAVIQIILAISCQSPPDLCPPGTPTCAAAASLALPPALPLPAWHSHSALPLPGWHSPGSLALPVPGWHFVRPELCARERHSL